MTETGGQDRHGWMRLLGCGLDRQLLTRLAAAYRHPADVFASSDEELSRRFQVEARHLARLRAPATGTSLDESIALLDRHRIRIVPLSDPDYPRNLFALPNPPAALFAQGTLEDYDRLAVTLVGPRKATPYGLTMAKRLARAFAPTMTVLSGAALGIDSAAHEATIESGGRTIAVIGCGNDQDYPSANRPLRRRIAENGAIVSQFPPGTKPLPGNFPMRNIVMAGLSLAVIVVEASDRSGALVTARAAAEEGRPVFAVPGDVTRPNSAGSNALLKDGAGVCTCADDVLADLQGLLLGELEGLRRRREEQLLRLAGAQEKAAGGEAPQLPDLGGEAPEARLLALIRHTPLHHDELVTQLTPEPFTIGDLSTALLMLELKGKIRQLPGRIYSPAG